MQKLRSYQMIRLVTPGLASSAYVRFGDRLDVLVLNAGIGKRAPIADYTVEDFDNLT